MRIAAVPRAEGHIDHGTSAPTTPSSHSHDHGHTTVNVPCTSTTPQSTVTTARPESLLGKCAAPFKASREWVVAPQPLNYATYLDAVNMMYDFFISNELGQIATVRIGGHQRWRALFLPRDNLQIFEVGQNIVLYRRAPSNFESPLY